MERLLGREPACDVWIRTFARSGEAEKIKADNGLTSQRHIFTSGRSRCDASLGAIYNT
jgi:hypothetical protein